MDEFNKLAESLKDAGITKSNMFGMPVLKLGKKPVAGLASDGINFKLAAEVTAGKRPRHYRAVQAVN